jgi:hypothetical protein
MAKSAGGIDAIAPEEPEIMVAVTVALPRAAVGLAVSVIVLFPIVGLALNDAVTPRGRPDAVRLTLPLNPPTSVIVTVVVAEEF